jgi:hypothetical protein
LGVAGVFLLIFKAELLRISTANYISCTINKPLLSVFFVYTILKANILS